MAYNVVLTASFKKDLKRIAKKHKQILADISSLIDELAENPTVCTDLGKNIFKIRVAISGSSKGKSGGARVITHIKIIAQTVVLAEIYLKNEYDTVSTDAVIKRLLEDGFI